MEKESKYKLIYLDCIGIAEGIRYLLHALHKDFEDYRVEYREVKGSSGLGQDRFVVGEEWNSLKHGTYIVND